MRCLVDLHAHTNYSGDGVSTPEELVASAKAHGLNALAITDHNTCEAIPHLEALGLLNRGGTPVDGFLIIPGVEVTTAEGHLLCIGRVLPNAAAARGKPASEVVQLIHDVGGLAIPPHPYDLFRAGIRKAVLDTLDIDALEVFNAASTLKRYNRKAFEYALRRGLPMTAASDAHHAAAVGTAFCILNLTDFTVNGVLQAILDGAELNERYLSAKESFKKTWANVLRLRKKPSKKPHKAAPIDA